MEKIAQEIIELRKGLVTNSIKMKAVTGLLKYCLTALFPHWHAQLDQSHPSLVAELGEIKKNLAELIRTAAPSSNIDVDQIPENFIRQFPKILQSLAKDAKAILAGDPAAQSLAEVVITYPGFYAISIHRLAHVLHLEKVVLIPRIWSEYAHSKTGIDIHPGASIAAGFCIDHGTGIVIGETATIEENVKIYQGVTLGALSVTKKMTGIKRHPTIEKNVILYSGATILGGDTVIGHDSVIGGNVWVTNSVLPNSKIFGTNK